MNSQRANDLATCHLRDLRQLSGQFGRQTLTASRRHRQSPLRRQIGSRLVEAGCT